MDLNKFLINSFAKFKMVVDFALFFICLSIGVFVSVQSTVFIYKMGGMMGTMTKKLEANLAVVCKETQGCVNVQLNPSYYTWDRTRGYFPIAPETKVQVTINSKLPRNEILAIFNEKIVAAGGIAYKININN
jgi:hypothetical protein